MNCPTRDELRHLCRDTIEASSEESLISHITVCAECQSALTELSNELLGCAPSLSKLAHVVNTPILRARLDELKFRRRPPQSRHSLPHEDLRPWIDEGSTSIGSVDHFDLIRCIGRGGMGIVFEAHDRQLRRTVAVKMMSPALLNDESNSERFLREACAAAAINSRSVVAIHAVSNIHDLPYLAMELVKGESLHERLAGESELDIETIIDISRQVAEGLAAAHAMGVIHRDIKPANILVSSTGGDVKITDFGLAHQVTDDRLTQSGTLLGTPGYLAPEQIEGAPADVRSDLFSLGSLIYHMCSGQPPFSAPSLIATLREVATSKPPPLADKNPRVPKWLSDLVEQLQAKNPEDRIQSAETVARSLRLREFAFANREPDEPIRAQDRSFVMGAGILVTIALALAVLAGLANQLDDERNDNTILHAESDSVLVAGSAEELMQLVDSRDGNLTVQLASETPYHLEPLEFTHRSVRFVAAIGQSPRLVFQHHADKAAISCNDGRLELHGVEIECIDRKGNVAEEEIVPAPVVLCENGTLFLVDCDVISDQRACIGLIHSDAEVLETRLQANFDAIVCESTSSNSLSIRDSSVAADVGIRIENGFASGLHFSHSTFAVRIALEMDYSPEQSDQVSIVVESNQFDCDSVVAVNNAPILFDDEEDLRNRLPFFVQSTKNLDNITVTLFSEEGGQRLLILSPPESKRR